MWQPPEQEADIQPDARGAARHERPFAMEGKELRHPLAALWSLGGKQREEPVVQMYESEICATDWGTKPVGERKRQQPKMRESESRKTRMCFLFPLLTSQYRMVPMWVNLTSTLPNR